jgi:predicted O-methyltransferase YrrM
LYTHLQLTKKYIKYYLTASNGRGHGVHSPFVFEFIKFVLNDKTKYSCYSKIENLRQQLLKDKTPVDVEDFGAGSSVIKTKKRTVKDIAASSLKAKKYSRLLFRMVQYYATKNVLELGTSLGTTTAYIASANNYPFVTSMEGSVNIANIAQQNFALLRLQNIHVIEGDFDHSLPVYLSVNKKVDFAFLDGNHRKIPTLGYFEQILLSANEQTIIVFDDIHWSKEMEETWESIKLHEAVTLSIDLFFIGIVFIRKDFKVKQHFVVRY